MTRDKKLGTRTALALAAILTSGAIPAEAASAASATVLRMATLNLEAAPSDPVTGYPGYGEGERLLFPQPGAQKPWLATSVEMIDPQHWRITLRDGVTFADGAAMTSAKVAAWLANELAKDYDPGVYTDATVATDGPLVVTVAFPKPQPGFGWDLSYFSLPVYDVDALNSIGDDYSKLAGLGIFTGPYQLASVSPTEWIYRPNPHYWAGTPALAEIDRIKVSDEQAGIRAVQAGEVDVLELVSPKMKPLVEAIPGLHFVTGDPALQPEFVAMRPNLSRAPWNDPVVRQALAMTVDSADLSAKASFGTFTPLKGIFPPSAVNGLDWMVPDIDQANALLDRAGWVRGPDGVRQKDGVSLSAKLLTSESFLNDISVVFAESAKAAGFALVPTLSEAQTVYDAATASDFDIIMTYGQNTGYDGDPSAFCDMFDPAFGYAATTSAVDPAIRGACDTLATTRAPASVTKTILEAQKRNAEAVFVIPMVGFVPASVTNDTWATYRPNYWFDPLNWQTKGQ